MGTTPMFAPSGQTGDIPNENVAAAQASGFKTAYTMYSPDGKSGYIPEDRVSDAMKSGFTQVSPQQRQADQAGAPQEGLLTKVARGTTLGAAQGAGIPETQTPVRDLASGLNQQVNQAAGGWNRWTTPRGPSTEQAMTFASPAMQRAYGGKVTMVPGAPTGAPGWGQGGPLWGTLAMIGNMLKGAATGEVGSAKEAYQGAKQGDPEMVAHGLSSGITRPLMMKESSEAPTAVSDFPSALKTGAQEVMGEGPSKFALKGDLHAHAQALQSHVAQVADTVHNEAQQAMAGPINKLDSLHPEGSFPKADIAAKVNEAVGDIIKNPEAKDRLPATISRLTAEEPSLLEQASVFKGAGKTARAGGGVPANEAISVMPPAARARFLDSLSPEERATFEAPKTTGGNAYTAQQLQQLRSDLGRELGGLNKKGALGAAANRVYGVLSDELRGKMSDNGLGEDWINGNAQYKSYMDDFVRGPVNGILEGQNAAEIMRPLTGDSGVPVSQTLSKYASKGMDMKSIMEETKRFGGAQTILNRFGKPGRLDLILAGISPKMAALRIGMPRAMRSPSAISKVFGKGFEDAPEVSAAKVALKKAARR